ncbi:MAG: hypothetical protein NTU59_02830 [Coprothermobacterota bacterium]|nr:hypothetical protein [Coprothermobacterota bacterium]
MLNLTAIQQQNWEKTKCQRMKSCMWNGPLPTSIATSGSFPSWVSRSAGAVGVGIQKTDIVGPGRTPVVLIEVEEITPYLVKVTELGGHVVLPKTPIPNMGWFAHIVDFDGNLFGLIQAPSAP